MTRIDGLLRSLEEYGTLPCLAGSGQCADYGMLLSAIARAEDDLVARGIGAGSIVALRADYSLEAIALLLAVMKRRAVAALLPRNQDPAPFLRDSCSQWLADFEAQDAPPAWSRISEAPDHELLRALRNCGDGGLVIFTSGSSGKPKAALQGTERFLAKFGRPGRRMRTLAFLLFDHVAGMDTLFYTLAQGGTLVITRRRDPRSVLELMRSEQVEVLPASPSFLRLLCLDGESSTRKLPHLKVITYGAEPMDPATLARLNDRFPGVQLTQKYGTTETGSPRSVSRGNDSLWLKLRGDDVETRVIDDVLWIRSEGTILGYLNAPTPVDAEGWYCTGDRVAVDGEWIRFLCRDTDVINVGGEKVAPAEVEQVLLELDFVREASVRGERNPLLGQIVTALVVLVPQADPKEALARMRLHCAARLPRHKVPVKIDLVTGTLANERQKILRNIA